MIQVPPIISKNHVQSNTTTEEIRALAASGASMDDVSNQLQKTARIGPELIKYIAKTKVSA